MKEREVKMTRVFVQVELFFGNFLKSGRNIASVAVAVAVGFDFGVDVAFDFL